ncbi:MAG: hypothetical protein E5299_01905 [Burkholderia gladioli]|nr:MAG: hypothetical protein E5299_01905 [Burkholderia gladioli]
MRRPVDEIVVFYRPSYNPELNPDEMLNTNLQANVTKQTPESEPRGISRKPSSGICVVSRNHQSVSLSIS